MDFPIKMSMSMVKNVHLFGNFIVFANGQYIVIVDFNPRVKKIRRLTKVAVPNSDQELEENPWIFRRPIQGITCCFYDRETDTLVAESFRHDIVVIQNCFWLQQRRVLIKRLEHMQIVHGIEKLSEREYLLLGKGAGFYNILHIRLEELEFEKIEVKGVAFDTNGSEFSMNTALMHTINPEKRLRFVISENDLLHFDEISGMIVKQVLYNVVFSYEVLPIPGFPDHYVAPSVD